MAGALTSEVPRWYALCLLLLTACTSLPPQFEDGAHEVDDSELVVSGEILYHDNMNDFFVRDKEDTSLDLKATIGKITQGLLDFAPRNRRVLSVKSTISGPDWSEAIQWSVRYNFDSYDRYGTSDYHVVPNKLPPGLVVSPFSTKGLREKRPGPFSLLAGTWNDQEIHILVTRTFDHDSGAWRSLLNEYQRFQILTRENLLLGEIIASGWGNATQYKYRIAETVLESERLSMIKVLSSVATLHVFLAEANGYRSGWSPDIRWDKKGQYYPSDLPELW